MAAQVLGARITTSKVLLSRNETFAKTGANPGVKASK